MRQMANQRIVAHGGWPLQRGVYHRSVLNAGAGTNTDLAIITAQDRRGPDTRLGSDDD